MITSTLRNSGRRMLPVARIKLVVSCGSRAGRNPQNRVERGHGVEAPIEPENILVQISLQMVMSDGPMMGAQNPRL